MIAMVKKSYRYKLLQRFFDIFDTRAILRENAIKAKMKSGTMGLSEGHTPHLHDVMDILNEVWEEITAESVKNCWKKSSLINDDMTIETHANDNQSDTNDTEELFGILVSFVKNND